MKFFWKIDFPLNISRSSEKVRSVIHLIFNLIQKLTMRFFYRKNIQKKYRRERFQRDANNEPGTMLEI